MKDSAEKFLAQHAYPGEPPVLSDGRLVDGWKVIAFLGRGGNGEVYRVVTDSMVAALKVLVRDTDTARARFVREASLLAKMDNPAFPQFIAQGAVEGRPYFVTELLEPRDLPSSDAEVADFLLKLCVGIAALHRMGYVHRDIKPGNILWRSSASAVPVLIDLGLVKDVMRNHASEGTSLTLVDGHVAGVGTPGYAAPEQLVGDALTPSADIHALGVLANTCFGGHPPFAWGRIIDRATGSIPSRRYPDVAAFTRAIRRRHLRRYVIGCAVLLVIACAIAAIPLLGAKLTPSRPPRPPTIPYANPTKLEHPSSAIAERRQKLVREIKERTQKSVSYAKKASQKMDAVSTETERLLSETNKGERAVIAARIKILQSELNEYLRLRITATNEIDFLVKELKSMSDSASALQVTK